MKKLTAISILLVLLSVTAFAQLKVGFESNIWTDAVFFEKASGDMADADSVKGAFNVLSGTNLNASGLKLNFTYTGGNFEAFLQINGDPLVNRRDGGFLSGADNMGFFDIVTSAFGDYYVKTTSPAWVFTGYVGNTDNRGKVDGYRFANFNDFLSNKLENYGAIMLGGYRGVNGDSFYNFDAAGVPISTNGKAFSSMVGTHTDTDNLKFGGTPYVALGIDLNTLSIPLVIEAASNAMFPGYTDSMGLNTFESTNTSNTYAGLSDVPATSASEIMGVFRVSGGKIADFISFDVVYRINGSDQNTRLENNANVSPGPLGETGNPGYWNNEIGVYAGLDLFSGFSIGAGYTAAFRIDEKLRLGGTSLALGSPDGAVVERVNPLFSGIDLHLGFTGVEKLTINLTNNFSFAFQKGQNVISNTGGGKWIIPMGYEIPSWREISNRPNQNGDKTPLESFEAYYGDGDGTDATKLQANNMWNTDQKDSWIALWNTLGVSFAITDRATVSAVVSNQLGVYDFVAKPDEYFAKWTTDNFQVGVGATYAFSPNISFGAGLNLSIWGMTAEVTQDKKVYDGKIGEVRFAIPLQFKVNF